MREKLFTVTLDDCDVQTFRAGGNGGQKVDKTSSSVRIVHRASGARGESRESRSQHENKKIALRRMARDPKFIYWVNLQTGKFESDEAYLEREMAPENIKVEVKDEEGRWVVSS